MTTIHQQRLDNGLWLLAEPIAGVQSLSMTLLLPAGVATEPAGRQGVAAMFSELMNRGAGGKNAREHSDALDLLGVQRGTSVETHHVRFSATMIGSKLEPALPLLLAMATDPMLPEDALEASRDLCIGEIDSLDDEPQERCMLELRRLHYPEPMGRSPLGVREDLEKLTLDDVRSFWKSRVVPDGAVLSFAGKFDWPTLRDAVQRAVAGWSGRAEPAVMRPEPERSYHHLHADTTQVHIALAYDALPEVHPDAIVMRAATAVLSGGMSGRLFTEVREKRGLVYSVYAAYAGYKDRGAILGYAGTTTPRAQETLDVFTNELRRLSEGVSKDEFDRAIVGMKSRIVMQGESTGARAGAIAVDQYLRGKPRTLADIAAEVDSITLDRLVAFVRANEPGDMTIVTIGPQPLRAPERASAGV